MLLQQIHDEGITPPRALAPLKKQHHQVHFTNGAARTLHQAFPQQVMGFVNARRVHQNHLGHLRGEDCPQAIAGGLGHRGCDRNLLPHQLIHQR